MILMQGFCNTCSDFHMLKTVLMILLSIVGVIRHLIWQLLELASELESDLPDTVEWGKNWLIDFNTGKTQLFSFACSNNTGSIDVKMNGSVLDEKSSFQVLPSLLNWIGALALSLIAKTASKKIGALICSMMFLSPEVALFLYKSTICPCMEYFCHI